MNTIRLVRRIGANSRAVESPHLETVRLLWVGLAVAALLLSGCTSSTGGSGSASQVTVTYERSEGQPTIAETAPDPTEPVAGDEPEAQMVEPIDEIEVADLEPDVEEADLAPVDPATLLEESL